MLACEHGEDPPLAPGFLVDLGLVQARTALPSKQHLLLVSPEAIFLWWGARVRRRRRGASKKWRLLGRRNLLPKAF